MEPKQWKGKEANGVEHCFCTRHPMSGTLSTLCQLSLSTNLEGKEEPPNLRVEEIWNSERNLPQVTLLVGEKRTTLSDFELNKGIILKEKAFMLALTANLLKLF